jgi:DNA-binding transcriptional LysR family regulator
VATVFRLAYVPGVTPDKWVRMWNERYPGTPLELVPTPAADAVELIRERAVDAALLRMPDDRTGLHAIPLYTEATVVVAPKDHHVTAADELTPDDLADEPVLRPLDDVIGWVDGPGLDAPVRPETTEDALQFAAGGMGLLVLPQSLFRLHFRKDLVSRPIPDAPVSRVALSWLEEETTEAVEWFIGVVRGRTANSTRGMQPDPPPKPRPAPQRKSAPPRKKPRKR